MSMNLSPLFPTLKDYVKADISFTQKGAPVETPFDEGIVSFVVGGGRFFPEINDRALSMTIGETATFTTKISEYQEALSAEIPIENTPGGLQVGDIVKLSNGLKVRVTEVTEKTVKIDANAPLAGQNLDVTMKILERFPHTSLSQATFAAGCFWGLELAFMRLPGVAFSAVGYTQGRIENPSYEQVCSGSTGHAEAVTVLYNPAETTYDELLKTFFDRHDPTHKDRQGNDVGTQYRGGIYYHSLEQRQTAEEAMMVVQRQYSSPLATELVAATKFWMAEDYHQQYLEKGGQSGKKTASEKIRCYG